MGEKTRNCGSEGIGAGSKSQIVDKYFQKGQKGGNLSGKSSAKELRNIGGGGKKKMQRTRGCRVDPPGKSKPCAQEKAQTWDPGYRQNGILNQVS